MPQLWTTWYFYLALKILKAEHLSEIYLNNIDMNNCSFLEEKIPVKRAKQPERKIEVKFPANMHISTLCFTYCAKFCIFWSLVKRKCTENYSFVHVSGVPLCSIIDPTLNKSMYTSCLYQLPFFSFKKFCSVFERSFTDCFRSIYLILAKKGPDFKKNKLVFM